MVAATVRSEVSVIIFRDGKMNKMIASIATTTITTAIFLVLTDIFFDLISDVWRGKIRKFRRIQVSDWNYLLVGRGYNQPGHSHDKLCGRDDFVRLIRRVFYHRVQL